MKHILHRFIVTILFWIGFITVSPSLIFSQYPLKLKLKGSSNNENTELQIEKQIRSSQKLVKQIDVYNESGAKLETVNFAYDTNSNVIELKVLGNEEITGAENAILYYKRTGNKLILSGCQLNEQTGVAQGPIIESVHCDLNDLGYIIKEQEINDDSSLTFEYNENGETQSYTYQSGSYTSTQQYTWENGNIMNGNGGSDEFYKYTTIENKSNIDLSKLFTQTYQEDIYCFALCGYKGNANKNLMSELQLHSTETYEYKFDNDGYVIQIDSKVTADSRRNRRYIISYTSDPNPDPDPDPTPDNPTTGDELGGAIEDAPEGSEEDPTEIFIPTGGITLDKPIDINKHIRLSGGTLKRSNGNHYALFRVRSGYSLELKDITIDGGQNSQKDGSLIVYGKLILKDGVTIKNCYRIEANQPSGVICVAQNGVLTMDGGTISGNTGPYGGAVYNEGTFTMTGGELTSNKSQIGTVVNNSGGQFIMTGGKITSNKVTEGCGGVYVGENSSFTMTGGELSGNEDFAIYTWSDLQAGGAAKVSGITLLNEGNRLLIPRTLQNNWQIRYSNTPQSGTVIAVGYKGYQLTNTDLQRCKYYNDALLMKLSGNSIVTYEAETDIDRAKENKISLSSSGNQVLAEGLPVSASFTIFGTDGRLRLSLTAGSDGQCRFTLDKGIYYLKCKKQTIPFVVK